ncbi:hypothetical protein DH2020_038267 [Rehmannia glutinosa]|uniref:Pentatricopeptide repeat-containing protein n=1 Tax=Rehmannia glutinosa TaxID=99300 RepID=A0ABR0V196_REHGL
MSKALLSLIKPRHHHQPKSNLPTKFFITPHIRKLANEICEILRTQEKQWEETLQNRFFEDEIAPSEVAHLVFDKIRDCELGLKFFGFVSQNSFSLDGFAYSSLLKLLARSKLFEEIDNVLLDCMQCEEKLPTREALDVVIRAYADSGLVSKALELYSFVLNNFNVVPHLSACNSLLNGLIKDGNMKAAWHVFDEMVKRDAGAENCFLDNYSVCIMVKGLCKEGKVEKGRRLIEKRGDVKRAYGLLEDLKVKGFLPTQETYGALISGFCKRGDFKKVDEILNEMESSGLEINVQVYNNVVDAKYKFGLVGEALETTRKMIKDGYNLDIVTYNTLISNACRDGKVQEAEKLLKEVTNSGLVPNKLSFTPLIHAYCREGDFDRASSLLVEMTECGHKPDLITYGGLIHGLVVAGEVDAALTIRSKMMERGVSPDTCIYNVLMNGLCKKGKFADAKQLLIEMLGLNVSPDAYVYATLVDGYIRSGNFDDAKKLFDDIIERGVDPGLVGYNAMIKGHCKLGMMKDAVFCIDKMTKRNISPDEFTYSTIIDGYVKQNDLYCALAMFCHALKQNFAPNIVAVAKRENCKSILVFEEMLMSKCNPNDITFHYLVNGLSNEVPCAIARTRSESDPYKPMLLDIFGRIVSDGWQPISAAYVSIIACLCLNRMLGSALQLTDKILNKGFPLDSVILAALLHGVCSVGKSKDWRNIITYKLIEPKIDVALKYLSIFGRYSTREVTTEASLVLHTLLKEMRI